MTLSNVYQPTAGTGIVHHVYSTCSNARTLFSPHTIMFCVCTACFIVYRYACVFGMHACVNLLLMFSVRSCILYVHLIKFAFHLAACLCVSIINGAAKYSHHTHFYSPSLELCVL